MGTAFDYWMRAWLARTWPEVPRREGIWIAEQAARFPSLEEAYSAQMLDRSLCEIRQLYDAYISGAPGILGHFLRGCLFLARLDVVLRSGQGGDHLLRRNEEDFQDLLALARLTEHRHYLFQPQHRLVLNPTFGAMSDLVGGADADLVIDNRLIDIKVRSGVHSPRTSFQRQLIGYWLLAAMEGDPWPIDRIEVYLARDGILYTLPIANVVSRVNFERVAAQFLTEILGNRPYSDAIQGKFEQLRAAVIRYSS